MAKITVIGAGFAGISAATFLAKAGHTVTVLEKNATPGGRARKFESNGFLFDMGPSWYWMPDVFERYFAQFGKKVSDYYQLTRIDPSYQVFFGENNSIKIPANFSQLQKLFDNIEPGAGKNLQLFLQEAEYKYQVGITDLVYKPGENITEFFDVRLLKGLLKMHVFKGFSQHVKKYFTNPKLVQLLEFPVLFLGAKPEKTPALYSLMNYADIKLGTWYPMGGMHKIIEGMVDLAKSLGVVFKFNQNVTSFTFSQNKINGVLTEKELFKTDVLVGGADYHHIDKHLLPKQFSNYSSKYWNTRTLAPSSLIFYLGINKRLKNLLHHNLFFDKPFSQHAIEIYDQPQWPSKPLFYVSAPSVTDSLVAPQGCENLFVLIPVAPGITDTEQIREKYYQDVLTRLENLTEQKITPHVVYKRSYALSDFKNDYNAFKGNAYGLANTLKQTAILKPKLRSKKVKNLYYTGQLTVPGPGVPPSLISGEVVSNLIIKNLNQ